MTARGDGRDEKREGREDNTFNFYVLLFLVGCVCRGGYFGMGSRRRGGLRGRWRMWGGGTRCRGRGVRSRWVGML